MPTKNDLVTWDKRAAILLCLWYDENAWMRRNRIAIEEKHRLFVKLMEASIGLCKIPGWDDKLKAHLAKCPGLFSMELLTT